MIKQQIVNGKSAMVAYLKEGADGGFEAVEPAQANIIKVIYPDGTREFWIPEMWASQTVKDV